MANPDTVEVEEFTIEKAFHRYVAKSLDNNELVAAKDLNVTVRRSVERLATEVIADWTSWGHKMVEDKYPVYFYIDVPSSWWQHLKRDHAPDWFIKRYPVETKTLKRKRTVRFTRYTEYPDMAVDAPTDNWTIKRLVDRVEE